MPSPYRTGQLLICSMGGTPTLNLPNKPQGPATASDHKEFLNILPGGTCNAPQNPSVMGLMAATGGHLVPGNCMPNCPSRWIGVSINQVSGNPPDGIVVEGSQLLCTWGGIIRPA